MECPQCKTEIPGVTCPGCNKTVPDESDYCLYCGVGLKGEPAEEDEHVSAGETNDFDLDDRTPCSDGNCIGIIINGKCNICGKRYKGKKK